MKKISVLIASLIFVILFTPVVWAETVGSDHEITVNGWPGLYVEDYGALYPDDEFAWGTLTIRTEGYPEIIFNWSGFYHKMHPDGDPLHEGGPGPTFSIPGTTIEGIGHIVLPGVDEWNLPATEEYDFTPASPQQHGGSEESPHWDTAPKLKVTHTSHVDLPGAKEDRFLFEITGISHAYEGPLVPEPATIISAILGLACLALRKFRG